MEITTKENEIKSISEPARNSLISNNINPEELMKHYNGIKLSNNPDIKLYCDIIRKNNRVKSGRLTLDGETIREFQSKRNFKEVTLNLGYLETSEILEIVNDFHSKLQKENKGDICATYAVMVGQWLGYELKNSESKESVGVDACELPYTLIEDGYENMGKKLSSQELNELPDGSMILIRNEGSGHLEKFEKKVKLHVENMSEEDKLFPTHVVVKINGKWHESRAGRLVESTSEELLNERNSNSHITHVMKPKENTKKHETITIKQMCTPLRSAGDALNYSRNNEGFSGVAALGNYYNEKNNALSNIIETEKLLVLLEKIKEENKIATLGSIPTQS
jgi:hypothetical protein